MLTLFTTLLSLAAPASASAWVDGTYVCDIDNIKSTLTISTVKIAEGVTMAYVVDSYHRQKDSPGNLVFRGLASAVTFPKAEELMIPNGPATMTAIRFLPDGTPVCVKQ